MNKKLGLAVASALLAVASSANAGITVPAGDWTLDFGGNVNAFYTHSNGSGAQVNGENTQNIRTGLLPSAIGIGGKTRQNDLDVAFQFTFFVGADDGGALSSVAGNFNGGGLSAGSAGANTVNVRQAFLTFGDASWGTIKLGRDLGIFGSDAILSDMTLLGVGTGANGTGGSSTLGRIGSGYIYADWVGQVSYWSPNWNGFSFGVGVRDPWTDGTAGATNNDMGFEGKVSYEWAGDFAGKVWLGGIHQKIKTVVTPTTVAADFDGQAVEVGGKVSAYGFGLLGYYYDGKGIDQSVGLPFFAVPDELDASGGYVQLTYTIPGVGTKLGASWGESKYDTVITGATEATNKSWIIGAYHPLTKSLNLVAEYTDQTLEATGAADLDIRTVSLGAIMFF